MEEIEIPSHFLCPISLQLMKDPVTILTGITYDREYIEKWLFTCKNTTCPVTKLRLLNNNPNGSGTRSSAKERCRGVEQTIITPNHTLRRLIQSWCTLHESEGVDPIPTPRQPILVSRAYVTKLISDARLCTKLSYSRLHSIRSLAVECRAKTILESCGAFEYVGSILLDDDVYVRRDKEEALSFFAQVDDNVSIFKGLIKNNGDHLLYINSIVELLRFGSSQVKENAIQVLRCVYKVTKSCQLCDVTCEIIRDIVNVVRDNISNQSAKCALKLLMELNQWGRNRVKAVGAGLIHILIELLVDGLDRRLSELALVVLDQLCGCAEGRAELVGHGLGLAIVSKKILRVSHVASDRAVKILSLVSRYSATARVLGEMMEVGVVVKLCLVLQVECSLKTKQRAKEMLKLHSSVWKMSPCTPPHLLSSYPPN